MTKQERIVLNWDHIEVHIDCRDPADPLGVLSVDLWVEDAEADPVHVHVTEEGVLLDTSSMRYVLFGPGALDELAELPDMVEWMDAAVSALQGQPSDEEITGAVRSVVEDFAPQTYNSAWVNDPSLIVVFIDRGQFDHLLG